jgi:hypothetical protein
MKKLLLILALPIVANAQAANTAVLTWTAPTTYTDGTPIVGTLGYNVYQGAQGSTTKTKVGAATSTTFTVSSGLASGSTVCFQVSTTQGTQESALSNEACKTFPPPTPQAPTGLRAQ